MSRLLITRLRGKICTAVVSGGRVSQLTLEPEQESAGLNNIYVGRVQRVLPGIGAAFVEYEKGTVGFYGLEENRTHWFCSPSRDGKLREGDLILVQVAREAVKTKAAVLTSAISLPGRCCVLRAAKGGIGFSGKLTDQGLRSQIREAFSFLAEEQGDGPMGVIIRTNAGSVPPEQTAQEYRALLGLWQRIREEGTHRTCFSCVYRSVPSYIAGLRDIRMEQLEAILTDDRTLFGELETYLKEYQRADLEKLVFYEDPLVSLEKLYSLERELERALQRVVWLKSGGYLVIEPTEAMVVIDVNTGKYAGTRRMEDTIRKINREAAEEIGRQLQLRNLSGIIIIDFIDMKAEEDRLALLAYMKEVAVRDPVPVTVVEMTKLNLVELTRKKVRKPLHEQVL